MPFVWRGCQAHMASMSSRPTRQSAKDALEKIRGVLAWESCSEKSEAFQAAAAQMEREFASAKRRRVALAADSEAEDESEVESDDESEDGSGCESEDGSEDSSGGARSAPSSADLYSAPGDSSEDEDSLSEAESSDVEVAIEPVQPDVLSALSDTETELPSDLV